MCYDELLITSTWGKSEILEEMCFCYLQISKTGDHCYWLNQQAQKK